MNVSVESDQKNPGKAPERDHAMFDAELSGAVLNFQLLTRILTWLVPYKLSLWVSAVLVLAASFAAVLMEVVISRVLVDYIIAVSYTHLTLPTNSLV